MVFLRQSTAVDLAIGPFLDATDGVTAETGLTISQADVRLKKNNAAWGQINDSTAATHEENGWYEKEFDTTDTDTVGRLVVAVHESGALPVWHEFWVLEEAVYDAFFAASAVGYVANAPVNVAQLSGDSTAADNAEAFFDGTGYAGTGNTIPTVTSVTNQVTANVTALSGDTTAADNAEAFFDGTGYAGTGNTIPTVTTVTNQVTANMTAISGDSTAADNLESYTDGTEFMPVNAYAPKFSISGGTLTTKKPDGSTNDTVKTLTTDAAAVPIIAAT